jgi:hypothetical protein
LSSLSVKKHDLSNNDDSFIHYKKHDVAPVVRRHSVAAVGRDEERGSLEGEQRVAHVRSAAVRAAPHVDAAGRGA